MAEFISIPGNPPPAGAEVFDLYAADGTRLRAALFPAQAARAGVVLLNGRAEFIEKYFEAIGELNRRGYSVATMDWRGQGLSQRLLADSRRGHVADFAAYRDDLRTLIDKVARPRLPSRLALLTHSMGGAPALQLLADGLECFRAAALCAPMTRLLAPPMTRFIAEFAARAACAMGAGGQPLIGVKEHSTAFEGNVLTSDKARHDRFRLLQEAEPRAVLREPTFGWLLAAARAMNDLHRPGRFKGLTTPTLIISAGRDFLVDSDDHARLAAESPLIERRLIDGALHEIIMEAEPYRQALWAAFDEFVSPRIS
jgi:lysophospholipase